jgi:hypothetical protein
MHYIFGYRHAEEQIEHRQQKIEARAEQLHLAT